MEPGDVGSIVAAACLAHDIGNPPFGHAGESAIAEWFSNTRLGQEQIKDLSKGQKADFERFEGNAQGFRILTRLQNLHNPGLQLTCATLAAFTKYPRGSSLQCGPLKGVSWKKHGFFQADRRIFDEVASAVGLLSNPDEDNVWCRHPLAYLVEAADDICYKVNDLEDGFRVGHVSLEDTKKLLLDIFGADSGPTKHEQIDSPNDKIGYLRAKTINHLIDQTIGYFEKNSETILHGRLDISLVKGIPSADALDKIIDISKDKIYRSREVLQIEAAGFQVLGGLLEDFLIAVNEVAQKGEKKASAKSQSLFYLLPPEFRAIDSQPEDTYTRTLMVTDYVSGMTDSFAVSLYKQLTGISLPSG